MACTPHEKRGAPRSHCPLERKISANGVSQKADRNPTQVLQTRCVRALLTPFVLQRALHGPVYGWTLRKTLQAWGAPSSAGTLYPLLNALEREGFLQGSITNTAGRVRKYYAITDRGRSYYTHFCRTAAPLLRDLFLAPTSRI